MAINPSDPRVDGERGHISVAEAEATTTRDELSREKLRYVRPGDIITPLK